MIGWKQQQMYLQPYSSDLLLSQGGRGLSGAVVGVLQESPIGKSYLLSQDYT